MVAKEFIVRSTLGDANLFAHYVGDSIFIVDWKRCSANFNERQTFAEIAGRSKEGIGLDSDQPKSTWALVC